MAAGRYHNLALRNDGTVVGWGYNNSSQTTIPSTLNDVVSIAAGGDYSMALRRDGTVVAWGSGPPIPAGLINVVAMATKGEHSLAVVNNGAPAAVRLVADRVAVISSGENLVLESGVAGTLPMAYQWQFNGVNLDGANSPILALSSLKLADVGRTALLLATVRERLPTG